MSDDLEAVPTTQFSIGDAFSYGWDGFMRNPGPLLACTAAAIGVSLLPGLIPLDSPHLGLALSVVGLIASVVIGSGVVRMALGVADGRPATFADLLATQNLGRYALASLMVWPLVILGATMCLPGLIAWYFLQFYAFAVLDDRSGRTVGAWESLAVSARTVRARPGQCALVMLLVLALNIGGASLCVVGLLATLPMTAISSAYAWRIFTGTGQPQPA